MTTEYTEYTEQGKGWLRVLTWMVTSNHTHLLVTSGERGTLQVSEALQFVHGKIAQH